MAGIRIYTDENVNPAIVEDPAKGGADGLRRRRVEAWSAGEAGNLSLDDEGHLEYGAQQRAILFTHDPDLIALAQKWTMQGRQHWGVIYVHQGSLTIGEMIRRLKDYAETLDAGDMRNRVEYL